MYELLTIGAYSMTAIFLRLDQGDLRAKKVAAGQADGIQPRTIEVFQVGIYMLHYSSLYLTLLKELWTGRTATT